MTLISHKFKFIFVHVPKTGGTSFYSNKNFNDGIFNNLLDVDDIVIYGHLPIKKIYKDYTNAYSDYFKFCFVRNPWDRVSSYFFAKKYGAVDGGNKQDDITSKIVSGCKDINDFVTNFDWGYAFGKKISLINKGVSSIKGFGDLDFKKEFKYNNLVPQIRWISDDESNVMVDYIARYENFSDEVSFICNKLGVDVCKIPCNRRSKNHYLNYRELYNDESRKIIADIYKEDIKKFNYRF